MIEIGKNAPVDFWEIFMKKKIEVGLKKEERDFLRDLIRKGKESTRKLTRARILLLREEGKNGVEIGAALGITSKTVESICRRYKAEGLESALNERPRSGAPTKFNGKARAKITALACTNPPEGRSQWSLRLLADKAVELELVDSISHTDVLRILKKTK